jgi:peptide/nickel transport system substrate-binding protein
MNRRIIALFLALILILGAFAGCGAAKEEEKQPEQHTQETSKPQQEQKDPEPAGNFRKTTKSKDENALRIPNFRPDSLDLVNCDGSAESLICSAIYDTLMKKDENGEWNPWIASEVEVNEDGTVVQMTIRDDVYFHSGDHMTVEDILYSFEHTNMSILLSALCDSAELEIVDDSHVQWTFPAEVGGYYALIDYVGAMPIYNKSFCEKISDDPVYNFGFDIDPTGPYVFSELKADSGDVVLKKNENYWNGNGYLDTLYFYNYTGDTAMAFEAGEIDLTSCTADALERLMEYDNVQSDVAYSGIMFLSLNCATVFDDIRLREAVQYCFDREEVGMAVCDYTGAVAYNVFENNLDLWEDCTPHRDHDVEKARSMMSELGYSESNPLVVDLIVPAYAGMAGAEILKENLEECYFSVTIKESISGTEILLGTYDIGIMWCEFGGMFPLYSLLFDDNGLNMACYAGEDKADIIAAIQSANDAESARNAMLLVDSAMVYVPLCYRAVMMAADDQLELPPMINGVYDFSLIKWKN